MGAKVKEKLAYKTSRTERASYGLYFVGQNIFYVFIYMYLSTFFTDVGIPALTVAGIALVVKVWDAINDPIFGGFVDKVQFKKGKFIPWLRVSLVFIPLSTVFIFAIPAGIPLGVKVAWAVIGYILWDTAYTICDVPIFGLVTTMTDVQQERTVIMSIGRVAAQVAVLGVMFVVPVARKAIGGWLPTIIVLSIVATLTMLPICFKGKERIAPVKNESDVGVRDMLRFVVQNKYLLIFYGAYLLYSATNISGTLGMYFSRHCLGNEALGGLISLAAMIPGIIVGVCIPKLCRKFDKFNRYFFASIATGSIGVLQYFLGYENLGVFLGVLFVRGVPLGMVQMLTFMFTPDFAEYGHFKTGVSAPGIAFSLQTFSVKMMTAISTALGTALLGVIGFVAGEGAAQAAGFESKLWFIYMVVPAIGAVASLFVLRMYKLRDKDVQIMARCNAGEISREEADAALSVKVV